MRHLKKTKVPRKITCMFINSVVVWVRQRTNGCKMKLKWGGENKIKWDEPYEDEALDKDWFSMLKG